jgi:hypothetical protein
MSRASLRLGKDFTLSSPGRFAARDQIILIVRFNQMIAAARLKSGSYSRKGGLYIGSYSAFLQSPPQKGTLPKASNEL